MEEQKSLLEEAFGFAAEQRFYLRKAIQQNDLEMALRHGITLANELRSSKLTPENYYKLYALVFWELQHLASFIAQEERHGLSIQEVYEMVQHEGNVVPRLYLLVTVGTVYLQQVGAPVWEILSDLASMLCAVQHPLRGLFLRYYLLQMVKDKLQLGGDDVMRALQYLVCNFREATSLWARLRLSEGGGGVITGNSASHAAAADEQGGPLLDDAFVSASEGSLGTDSVGLRQKWNLRYDPNVGTFAASSPGLLSETRPTPAASSAASASAERAWQLDQSRHKLRLLVGAHLMHMARLPALTIEVYSAAVLPEVLRLSTSCEDAAGQAYLLQCFVEVFPDQFHLETLDRVLAACGQVHWLVDLRPLLQHILRRLTAYARQRRGEASWREAQGNEDTFELFHQHMVQLAARPRSPATPVSSLLALQLELVMSALSLHPGDACRMELVLKGAVELLGQRGEDSLDSASVAALVDILAAPLTQEKLLPAVLAFPHHATLMRHLDRRAQRQGALGMVRAVLEGNVAVRDRETLERLLALVDRLIRDEGADGAGDEFDVTKSTRHLEHDPVTFTNEQENVARLVHQVRNTDPDETLKMLKLLRSYFAQGGPHRMVFTLPASVMATLRLISPVQQPQLHTNPEEVFGFVQEMCASLTPLRPEESLRLWMLCAVSAERAEWGPQSDKKGSVCSRFIEQGLGCLEGDVHESQAQFRGLQLVVGTLREISSMGTVLHAQAAQRTMRFCSCLPSKSMQSRALCLCAGLFWSSPYRDPGHTLSCLRRALRLADGALHIDPTGVDLFVAILDQASHLFAEGNPEITAPFLSGLLTLCVTHLRYIESRAPAEATSALNATVADLKLKQAKALDRLQKRALDGGPNPFEPSCDESRSPEMELDERFVMLDLDDFVVPERTPQVTQVA